MLVTILLCCLPLSTPSLYMAYRLVKKRFLWSVFNQQAALILTVSGKMKHINIVALTDDMFQGIILPLSLATAIFRLVPDHDLGYLEFYPLLCSLLSYLELTWITLVDSGTMVAVIFRSSIYLFTFFLNQQLIQICAGQIPRQGPH